MRLPAPADWQIWSARRQNEFETCPRRFWNSCFAAAAGALPGASPLLRRYFFYARIVPRGVWLNILVQKVIRELFYRDDSGCEPLPGEALVQAIKASFRRHWLEIWNFLTTYPVEKLGSAEPWPLPVPLILEECVEPEALDPETLRKELETELVTRARRLAGAAWLILDTLPVEERVMVSSPVTVAVNHLAARMTPLVAYRRQTELHIVDSAEHGFDEGSTVLLHKFFAANRFGMLPQFVRSLRINPGSGELRELLPDFNMSAELKRLDLFRRTLSVWVDADGCCDSSCCRPDPAGCGKCRYRLICEK